MILSGFVGTRDRSRGSLLFTAGVKDGWHELSPCEQVLFKIIKQKAEGLVTFFEMSTEDILVAMDIQGDIKPGDKWVGATLSQFSLTIKAVKSADSVKFIFDPANGRGRDSGSFVYMGSC